MMLMSLLVIHGKYNNFGSFGEHLGFGGMLVYISMKVKATIPKLSSSLLLLRNSPPSKLSYYNYEILVLQRKVLLPPCRKNYHSDQD
jgi:hypothetical protein